MSASQEDSVSVVVPVYNELDEAIVETIDSALEAGPDEIIVVDDGSDEHLTLDKLNSLCQNGVNACVTIPHSGIPVALRHGFEAAHGRWVVWLSVGDFMYPDKIERCLEFASETEGCWAIFHDVMLGRPCGQLHLLEVYSNWARRLEHDNQFSLGGTMVTRRVATRHYPDASLPWCSDWDWACQIQYDGPGWHYLPEVLGEVHEHANGHTARGQREHRAKRDQCRATVARRWRGASKTQPSG